MKERILSVVAGIAGSLGSTGAAGIITDVLIGLCLAFIGGILGYFGNEVAKRIHQKIKGNEKRY